MREQNKTMFAMFSDDLGNQIFQYTSDRSAAFRLGLPVMGDVDCFVR
jgi:hypothetical protein